MHARGMDEPEKMRHADVARACVFETNIEQTNFVNATRAPTKLDKLAFFQLAAIHDDRANGCGCKQWCRCERDSNERHHSNTRERAIGFTCDER